MNTDPKLHLQKQWAGALCTCYTQVTRTIHCRCNNAYYCCTNVYILYLEEHYCFISRSMPPLGYTHSLREGISEALLMSA